MGEYNLYEELKDIEEIELFGVSPFGDNELIQKVNKIPRIKIYVYDLEHNSKELNEWKSMINNFEFVDSKYFENE